MRFIPRDNSSKQQKSAHDEIRTRAGFPPADLESAALDRSATCASVNVLVYVRPHIEDFREDVRW